MKYDRWRKIRDKMATTHRGSLRLDCMNPFRAMDHFVRPCQTDHANELTDFPSNPAEDLLGEWSRAMGVRLCGTQITTLGIRSFLKTFMDSFSSSDRRIWLPSDVFPTYRLIAESAGWIVDEFDVLPTPNWIDRIKDDGPSVAVLPIPLSPLGRDLQHHEIDFWQQWLRGDSKRILILDTVYAYQPDQLRSLTALFGERTITAFSVSKTWLERCVFGFAKIDESLQQEFVSGKFPDITVSPEEANLQQRLLKLMRVQGDMPVRQNLRFADQWKKLEPTIRQIDCDWTVPATGYFSILKVNYQRLYTEHGVLSVPATVFGSQHHDLSVISCLYDIKTDDEVA